MGDTAPLVSYIVVNWRTELLLRRALSSIYAQTHAAREVILVDNASPEFDPQLVSGYPGLKLIRNEVNRGFAAANNQGIAASGGAFVVLLNADAVLDARFTEQALEVFAGDFMIGTVVPKLLRDDGSGRIDSAGHRMYEDRTTAHIGKDELDQGQYGYRREVFGGTAAAIAYRRNMIEDIALDCGLFDEAFFAYFEDVDVDWRARLAGWSAVYAPECLAWHRGHGSGGRSSRAIQRTAEKNRYLMLARNDNLPAMLRKAIPLLVYELYHLARILLRPWVWPGLLLYLWHVPAVFAKRAAGQPSATDVAQTQALFRPRGLQPPDPELLPAQGAQQHSAGVAGRTSVIVLNFNGLEQTLQCLATIRAQIATGLEVIVVDNGSARDESAELRRRFPDLKVLRLEQNHGFAGGVNWGLTLASGDTIVLVNNDCLLERECIARLTATLRTSGHAAVSGRLVDLADATQVARAFAHAQLIRDGGQLPTSTPPAILRAVAESRRNHGYSIYGFIVNDTYGRRNECFYPSGGLAAIRREAIPRFPRLFPHQYFAYHEDAWLGFDLRSRGHTIGKEPSAVAIHQAGSTARSLGRVRLKYLQERNRCLTVPSWLPGDIILRMVPMFALTSCASMLALLARPADLLGWLGARLWILTHPLELLMWRSTCQSVGREHLSSIVSELSGAVRGRGGLLNRFSLWWCRTAGISTMENRIEQNSGVAEYG